MEEVEKMFSTREELLEKLRLGEDGRLELKEARFVGDKLKGPTQETLADEMAAFANSSGGVILIGVDNQRNVCGIPLEKLDMVEDVVRQACLQSINPALSPLIEKITLPDSDSTERPIIRIEVSPSIFVHSSPGGYFHRVGSAKQRMLPDQLARLFEQRSQSRLIRFDETPVTAAPLSVLEKSLWQRFISNRSDDSEQLQLKKLALIAPDKEGELHPTVAGLLMASRKSHEFLKGSFVQAVAYRGTSISPRDALLSYQLDAADITGPLDEQILQACAFIRRNMRVAAVKLATGGRRDIPQFDMLAVFEAMVNAVAHRDYSMPGAKVRVRVFDDRLEIYSPGMLTNTMTPESLPYRQASRNEVLTSLLARCPINRSDLTMRTYIMDKRGEGVSLILSHSEALSGKRPVYEMFDNSELRLTIYGAPEAIP